MYQFPNMYKACEDTSHEGGIVVTPRYKDSGRTSGVPPFVGVFTSEVPRVPQVPPLALPGLPGLYDTRSCI